MTSHPRPIDVVRRIFSSHEDHDTLAFRDWVDPDVHWLTAEGHPLGRPGGWSGIEAVVEQVVNPVNDDFENYRTDVHEMVELEDERVLVRGRYRARYRKTGRDLDADMCSIYTVAKGKVIKFEQYTDTAQFCHVMGEQIAGMDNS